MQDRVSAMILLAALAGSSTVGTTGANSQSTPTTIGSGGIATDIAKAGHSCKGGVSLIAMMGPEAQEIEAKGLRPMIARCDSGETYRIIYARTLSGPTTIHSVTPIK